jgi:XTP/dITP diphosphohydrolase
MLKLIVASKNSGKIKEFQRILQLDSLGIELVIDVEIPEVAETGSTFEENALLKATSIAKFTGIPAIADDSGLAIDVLNGAPGILSARWSGGGDNENIKKVLDEIKDVPESKRGAKFVAVIALAKPTGENLIVRGELQGRIRRSPVGKNGFGYDPIFEPIAGDGRTLAELDPSEKDAISHRSLALAQITPLIKPFLID